MRLIDADLLKRNITKWLKPSKPDETEMIEVADALVSTMMEIDEQPTAFDVDKVISELKRDKFVESECILSDVHQGYNAGLSRAIEIVKGGGVE
jgi:hypothetical protein|nr:MAG TPA: hypothetical protein [Caudoviricetes sp.]